MKSFGRGAFLLQIAAVTFLGLGVGCHSHPAPAPPTPTAAASAQLPSVGGEKAIELRRLQSGTGAKPEFLSVTLLPGRGMNVFQISAYLPGKGEVPLLASPSLAAAEKTLSAGGPDDFHGNQSFSMGGAFLFPFANRLVGPVSVDKHSGQHYVTIQWHGRKLRILANWHGKLPGAPWVAMHGDILNDKAASVGVTANPDAAEATGMYDVPANGQWFSKNKLKINVALEKDTVTATITATNTGTQSEPVGIGWHPYFHLPSGARANARLHIPSPMRLQVNNYDDVFPTGKLLPVLGTPYDFTAAEGAPLPDTLMDDTFVDLKRDPKGHATAEIRDLGTNYGLRVTAMTPKIRAFQVYSPVNQSFIALEPQFNYGDPFGSQWHDADTGMVTLLPGDSVTWKVQLQLFQPADEVVGTAPHPPMQ